MKIRIKTKEELLACGWYEEDGGLHPGPDCLGGQHFGLASVAADMLGTEQEVSPQDGRGVVYVGNVSWYRDEYWRLTTRVRIKTNTEFQAEGYDDYFRGLPSNIPGTELEVLLSELGQFEHMDLQWSPDEYVVLEPADVPGTSQVPAASPVGPVAEKPEIVAFRDATLDQARALVTCGFELETQSTEGHVWDDIESTFDEEAFDEAVRDRVDEIIGDDLMDHLPRDLRYRVRDEVYNKVRDEMDRDDFFSGEGDPEEFMKSAYSIPSKIEVVEDGSVKGFEFRTRGGLNYAEFLTAAKGIFRLSHEIDTGCSFHVHVAVAGVKHVYGDRFQRALVEYLIENIERAPASVRERWAEVRDHQYFKPGGTTGKYSFVHKHSQGTWEFRCFGNVKNAADAETCLNLALEAMQFAYRMGQDGALLSSERMFPNGIARDDWADLCEAALSEGKTLTQAQDLLVA